MHSQRAFIYLALSSLLLVSSFPEKLQAWYHERAPKLNAVFRNGLPRLFRAIPDSAVLFRWNTPGKNSFLGVTSGLSRSPTRMPSVKTFENHYVLD